MSIYNSRASCSSGSFIPMLPQRLLSLFTTQQFSFIIKCLFGICADRQNSNDQNSRKPLSFASFFLVLKFCPVGKFIVPGGIKSLWQGLSYRAARLHSWLAGTTTLRRSQLYPPVRDYEFGHRIQTVLSQFFQKLNNKKNDG
jgi:hypothetical protein